MELITERLIIRDLKPSDIDRFHPIANSDFVLKYLCMYKMNYEESVNYIDQMIKKGNDFAVALKDTDELIGKIHIDGDPLRYDVSAIDIAYWLGEKYTRQGYMTEALNAFIDWLLKNKDCEIVTANALAPNTASIALLKALGFTQEGYMRRVIKYNGVIYDSVPFSILKNEFYLK